MGIYYMATTAIGYRISTKNCYVSREEPNCAHNPPADAEFCPKCGTRIGTRQTGYSKEQYVDDFRDKFVNHLPTGYVFEDLYVLGDEHYVWIGYGSRCDNEEFERLDPKPYEEIKAELIAMLEPFTATGLLVLEDDNFGIWTIHAGH